MDRTDEFIKTIELTTGTTATLPLEGERWDSLSSFLKVARRLAAQMDGNEQLVRRMEKLTLQKEFSNDPTEAMEEIASLFEQKVEQVQRDLAYLKSENAKLLQRSQKQQSSHRSLIIESLSKTMTDHINIFKKSLKIHKENVELRKKRVTRYGQGYDQIRNNTDSGKYAMFTNTNQSPPTSGNGNTGDHLRNRKFGNPSSQYNDNIIKNQNKGSFVDDNEKQTKISRSYGFLNPLATSERVFATQSVTKNDSRLKGAQKIEATIMQMGELFSQMATLVSEQSETIARIEDDVEGGLNDTIEANESMNRLYEITKGNRGMIIKIFLLLVFFIFLFLVWT
eukprot:gene6819-9336_t